MADVQYHCIPQDEESKLESRLEPYPHSFQEAESTTAVNKSHTHWAWLAHAVLLSLSITFFTLSYCLSAGSHISSGHGPLLHTAPSAPVVEYEPKNAGLGPEWRNSPYVGHGAEVDNAWCALIKDGDVFVTEDEAKRLGLSPRTGMTQHPRTAQSGYWAGVEVFQQLRCLDLLRQAAYRNTHYPMDVDVDLDYCVELLRETIMCHGDAGIFSLQDAPEQGSGVMSGERLGFVGSKVCRSFEALKRWTDEHSVR